MNCAPAKLLKTLAAVFLTAFPAVAAAVSTGDFETILARIDTPRSVAIPFVEQRKNPLLKEPMRLTGKVIFGDDGRLSKIVDTPFSERVTISRDAVELERNGKTRRLSLRRKDDVRAFYVALRALLEGDANTLRELFDVEATTTDADRWTLVLEPAAPPLSEFLKSMVVSGRSAQVSSIRTVQSGDEWQEMTFDSGGSE